MPRMHYERGRFSSPRRVYVATPVTDGKPCDVFTIQLPNSALALAEAGIAMDFCIESFNCHVDDARNALVRHFMQTDCTDFVFIDADVGSSPDDLVRLVTCDRDIVAGVYPKKQDDVAYPVRLISGTLQAEPDGMLKVAGIPTGFLRIRRAVIEKLMEATAPRSFLSESDPGGQPYHPIFERSIRNGKRWSGDYEFCNKAADAGFPIYVDPEMRFTHSGGERLWTGCLGDYLREMNGLDHPEFTAAVNRLRGGDLSAETMAKLVTHYGNNWAASPEFLAAAYAIAANLPAGSCILETGSGLSTLVLALAAERSQCEVLTLEHDLEYHAKTAALLARHGLRHRVDLCHAPIKAYGSGPWYAADFPMLPRFALAVIDGPPRKFGRDNIFEHMGERVYPATWLIDDMDDQAVCRSFEAEARVRGRSVHVLGAEKKFAVCPVETAVEASK